MLTNREEVPFSILDLVEHRCCKLIFGIVGARLEFEIIIHPKYKFRFISLIIHTALKTRNGPTGTCILETERVEPKAPKVIKLLKFLTPSACQGFQSWLHAALEDNS